MASCLQGPATDRSVTVASKPGPCALLGLQISDQRLWVCYFVCFKKKQRGYGFVELQRVSVDKLGKIGTFVFQLCFKGQVGPSNFKKTNLVPQLLFLSQICPYTGVMLHNTMRLMLKSHLYHWLFLSFTICMFSSGATS